MSRESERLVVTAHFAATFAANWPTMPVAWPNHEFTTPSNTMFAVFNLVDRGTTRQTIGLNYVKRHRATVQVDVYTPLGQGTKQSRLVADVLESVYDTLDLVTSDGELVAFRTPSARDVAGNESRASNLEDNWGRIIVECPYERQEIVDKT